MKITATYKTFMQTAPDDGQSFTKVIHLEENMTIETAIKEISKDWIDKKSGNVELHWEQFY